MIALLQRVTEANVTVSGNTIGKIDKGLLVLLGVEKGDDQQKADKLIHRILGYRVFEDEQGKMNLSLRQVAGQLLLVPQFTLAADTQKGLRPSFSNAASPEKGLAMFNQLIDIMRVKGESITSDLPRNWLQKGQFGADMAVQLLNDGPVTFTLKV